jgi:hypothetical protein
MSFNLNSEYPTREEYANLKRNQRVKYADDLVLVAKEETVLQGMTDSLTEVRKRCRLGMNVANTKLTRIPWQPSPIQITIDHKTTGECGIFPLHRWHDNK